MDQPLVFSAMLGLARPWRISKLDLAMEPPRLDIHIVFAPFGLLACPACGNRAQVCGIAEQSWYQPVFFNKEACLHVALPLLRCEASCGCHRVNGPWAAPDSRFVLQQEIPSPACSTCPEFRPAAA